LIVGGGVLKPKGSDDPMLDTLLLLDGEIFPMDNGHWVKFEASRAERAGSTWNPLLDDIA
jgi:hypothetical protein